MKKGSYIEVKNKEKMINLTIKRLNGLETRLEIPNLQLIHTRILDYIVLDHNFHYEYLDEILSVVHMELLKIIGRYPENYKIPFSITPEVFSLVQRQENAVIATINDMKYIINIDVDLTQPWRSIPWNYQNEYNLNDEPVYAQVPEEREGGYIFIGNRLWKRESFLKYFIPA